jgi:UDP-N-acetylmuramate dehydrogenase
VQGNAGSFFMNPVVPVSLYNRLKESHATIPCYRVDDDNVKIPAAWLIEQCGWKGRSLGKAAVHARQPLVLVNAGGASGQDIMELCRCVQADVRERFGISLHPEVIVL